MSTNDLLQKLRKLLAESADSTDTKQPWQELLRQETSVPSRSIRAAEAVRGFAGSWAASYTMFEGHIPHIADEVNPDQGFNYRLGKRGHSEINFVPYNWNTNRFGDKGPSLVGHPVSFEVVGSTQKAAHGEWEFPVDLAKNMITVPTANTTYLYGNIDNDKPLWVLISEPGAGHDGPHEFFGSQYATCNHGLQETPKHEGTARYELFRVKQVTDTALILDGIKRLDEYFYGVVSAGDGTDLLAAKSITLLQPKVSRLAPVLDSDGKTFVFVPPERSAVGEHQLPHQEWILANGLSADYNIGNLTPIPKPLSIQGYDKDGYVTESYRGRVRGYLANNGEVVPLGRFRIGIPDDEPHLLEIVDRHHTNGVGLLVHIAEVYMNSPANSKTFVDAGSRLTGYFEVVGIGQYPDKTYYIECRAKETVSPSTGQVRLGPDDSVDKFVRFTFHLPVKALFEDDSVPYSNRRRSAYADDLDSARLTGLIDPKEVGRSLKVHGTNDVHPGGYSGRADRSIPNTREGVDPGSLLDLGFRAVLYTTKQGLIDWDSPIASNEVILDPSKSDEKQYVDIDYASGILKFSHKPVNGGDFEIDEKGRAVVYASFVPYSMEGGQRGSGVRLTGGDLHSANLGYPHPLQRDVFSKEVFFHAVSNGEITWGGDVVVSYDGEFKGLPKNGYLSLSRKTTSLQSPYLDTHKGDAVAWTYDSWTHNSADKTVQFFGLRSAPVHATSPTTFNVSSGQGLYVRTRPDVKARYDKAYGSSARTDVVRFAYGDITYNSDGSMTVMPTAVAGPAEELRAFFPLGNRPHGASEVARFHFEKDTQRWSTDDPPWYATGHADPPLQLNEIGIEVSRGRLYTNWQFAPKTPVRVRHVMGLIGRIVPGIAKHGPVPESFLAIIPDNVAKSINVYDNLDEDSSRLLSLRVEGGTIRGKSAGVVKDATMVDISASVPQRFIFGVERPLISAAVDRPIVEMACPVVKVFTTDPALAPTLQDLIDFYPGANLGRDGNGEAHFALSGRQVFAFPEKAYLASREFTFPLEFNTELRAIVDLRKVSDEGTSTSGRSNTWTHFELVVEHGDPALPVTLNDANEMALHFNQVGLYKPAVLELLKNANFLQSGWLNPDLGLQEHQLLFIGPNDPRFPHGDPSVSENQICLIYTGNGMSAYASIVARTNMDGGVLCELDSVNKDLKGQGSLLSWLGGSFLPDPDASRPQARFGGYKIDDSVDLYDSINRASGNTEHLGFPERGTRPLGRFVGSFKIKQISKKQDRSVILEAFYPTGGSSDWYSDQTSSGFELGLAGSSDRIKTSTAGWQGRLSWPLQQPHILSEDQMGSVAGLYDVYATFGVSEFNESFDAMNPLLTPFFSNPSFLFEVLLQNRDEWSPPSNVWSEMVFGDVVSFFGSNGIDLEGRVFSKSVAAERFTVLGGTNYGTVNYVPSYDSLYGAQVLGPNNPLLHPISVYGLGEGVETFVSIAPSTISGVSGAVAHLVKSGTDLLQSRTVGGEFLEGESTFSVPSSVLIGSGRVSMLSTVGAEPTGFALHDLIDPNLDLADKSSVNKSSVYIESGAFTTFVGTDLDSGGYYTQGTPMPPKDLQMGGVGGLRVSGDAHLWLDQIRRLRSTEKSAYVVAGNSPLSGLADAPFGRLQDRMTTLVPGTGLVVQEATVQIGLTQSDLNALRGFLTVADSLLQSGDSLWMGSSNTIDLGAKLFQFGQMAVASHKPLFMPSLVGSYIALSTFEQRLPSFRSQSEGSNEGLWKIVGSPMVVSDATALSVVNLSGVPHRASTTDAGRQRESQVVAIMSLRVEGFRTLNDDEFETDNTPYYWGVYRDSRAECPIYTGDVVDPGGSPTGAPASLRGLTIDPQLSAGKSYLSAELIPLNSNTALHRADYSPEKFNRAGVELLGVHDQVGRLGKHFSRAFFAIKRDITDNDLEDYWDSSERNRKARMVVLADEAGLVDGFPKYDFNGEISLDGPSGRVDFLGYPRRLGPGVIMDGGLGMVQANAFRARPRPTHVEHIGKLMVWGRGAYPLNNSISTGNMGSEIPSVFNTSEFYGEVSVANPQGRIVFESPQAVEGLVSNMLSSEFMSHRHHGPSSFSHYVGDLNKSSDVINNVFSETNPLAHNGVIVTDTLFPRVTSGSVYRTPGTTVYERAYRSLDATGSNPIRKSKDGTHNRSGIAGMGVPTQGEVLLLPQGPVTSGKQYWTAGQGYYSEGKTPDAAPLYAFYNGPTVTQMAGSLEVPLTLFSVSPFGINLSDIVGSPNRLSYVDPLSGAGGHKGQMGTASQAYRHSNSREDSTHFAKNEARMQVRILDGMVIEDVTNGTFYTAGSVGRDNWKLQITSGLGLPGDGTRSPVNGSLTVSGYQLIEDTTGQGINYQKQYVPEVVYDLGQHCDTTKNPFADTRVGFGDRVDSGVVRRPLTGHKFRITPNVEFVPVLGARGVSGGLIPTFLYFKTAQDQFIPSYFGDRGDALFYDLNTVFKEDDIGKMLYICGTDEYAYTGWWVITDVANPEDYGNRSIYAHPEEAAKVPSFACVRKMNWDGRDFNPSPIPIPNFNNVVSVCSTADKMTNATGRGHFSAVGAGNSSMDDLYVILHDQQGTPWIGVVPSGDFTFESAAQAANFLNNNDVANGKQWEIDVKGANPASANQFIFWEVRANALRAYLKVDASSYMASFMGGNASFQIYWRTRTDGAHNVFEGHNFIGFGYSKGHNLGSVRTVGDANNALAVPYRCPPIKFEGYRDAPARGLRWVFSHPLTEENTGSYVTLTKPPLYRFSTALPSQPALTSQPYFYDAKWTSGSVKRGDVLKEVDLLTDIFRVNRCATTTRMILGGDCEVFHPEVNYQFMGKTNGNLVNFPVMYSPLSVHGNWQDTDTGDLPDTGALNFPLMYSLQPIAREKIVTLSPSNAKSSVVFARGLSDFAGVPQGLQGVGPALATGPALPSSPTSSFSMEPWQLVSRSDLSRTTMAQPSVWNFDGRVELNNANLNKIEVTKLLAEAQQNRVENDATITEIQQTISDKSTEVVDIDAQLADTASSIAKVINEYQTQLALQAKIYATAQGQVAQQLEQDFAQKEIDYERLIDVLKIASEEVKQLEMQIVSIETAIADNTSAKASLEADKADILVVIAQATDDKNTLEKSLTATETSIADQESYIAQLTKEMVDWENTLEEYDANIDWEADYDGHDSIVSDLVSKIKQALKERTVAQGAVYTLLQQREVTLSELQVAVAKLDALASELASLDQRIVDAAALIAKLTMERDNMQFLLNGDYSVGLVTKLKTVQWDTVITEQVGVWNAYSPTVRVEVYDYWATSTAPIDLKTTSAELATALADAGLNVVYATMEKLLAEVEALGTLAADLADQRNALTNQILFAVKEVQNRSASIAHLQAIIDYWQSVLDSSILGPKLVIASPSTYMWTPAGEWWQLYQPAWDQHGPDASASPPTLRVDLTESFTQAIGPGSGLNTPHVNRFPRGVRLNRIWVNFGVWGNGDRQTTSRFGFDLPGFPKGLETGVQEENMVLDQMYTSFNLILEIPSQNSTLQIGGKRAYSGNEAFPMGGRMPTAATNHASNGTNDEVFPGGTIVVPLYVNREAGDVMPNVMERFVTVGPEPDQSVQMQRYRDWSGGDYEHGFGVSSPDVEDKSLFGFELPRKSYLGGSNMTVSRGMYSNAFNPVLWGGMDYGKVGDTELDGVFTDPRFARVQSSVFPRSSVVGGGLRSAFTSGLIPDGSLFSKYDPHSLSAATLTGITVAHSGLMPSAPRVVDGSYTAYNTRGGHTCPHGFTIALTPVGDAHAPYVHNGTRIGLDPHSSPPNMSDEMMTAHYGRTLENPFELIGNEPTKKPFKVGNWLENIVKKYGIYAPSGSMLPPGSRVYLEIAVGPGPAAKDQDPEGKIGAGSWVGNIKLSFDVETVDGTAWTQDVNILGDEEG